MLLVHLSLTVALSTIHVKERNLARFYPNLEAELSGSSQRPPTYLPFPPIPRDELRLDGYLEYPPTATVYKHPHLLRYSNSSPMAQQSVTLITLADGWHISV
ncbi:hypothetical protein TNCV_3214141 [Trichonephila clavipes]|nr:hypothetical protein TNCV_3214141 [Trichonephila clavipes]